MAAGSGVHALGWGEYCKPIIFSMFNIRRQMIFQQINNELNWHFSERADFLIHL